MLMKKKLKAGKHILYLKTKNELQYFTIIKL